MSTATAPDRRTEAGNGDSAFAELLSREGPYMRPELMQMKMENETIMAECKVHPRDFEQIKRELLSQLKAFPEMATDAIYEKPVGKDPDTGEQKYVRGLSIRAAEILAEAYRYNRIRSSTDDAGGDKVKIEATFTDFQGGRIWQDAGLLSKTYKDRSGKIQRINDDRFYNLVCKAEVSKRVREVILRSVNTGLKAWFENECERISAGLLDDETIEKIVNQYKGKNVTVEMLEQLIGRPRSMGWTQVDRQRLLSIWNALKDGETTVAEVFADKPAQPLPTPTKEAPSLTPPPPAEAVDLAGLDVDLKQATTISACEDAKVKWLRNATTEADRSAIVGKMEARAEEIRQAKKAQK